MSNGSGEDAAQDPGEQVGSVSQEAAKLFGALSDWAREQGPGLGDRWGDRCGEEWGDLAENAAAAIRGVSDHVDTGAPECTWCPVCRTVHLVRATSPEVREHLASAAASLLQAAAGLLASAGGPQQRARPSVEHIPLDGDLGACPEGDLDAAWPEEER